MKKFQNITKKQIEQYGVQALSDRPNSAGAYGGGGFSPLELKLWFDQLATFEANKINEIHNILASDEAAEYIAIALHDNGIHDLSELVAAIKSGALANILELYPTAGSDKRVNLQNAIYDIAKLLSDHDHDINEVLKKPPFTEYDPTVPAWAKKPNPPTPDDLGAPVKGTEAPNSTALSIKPVPADAAPYAEVVEIGGMTRKCANLFDVSKAQINYRCSMDGSLVKNDSYATSDYIEVKGGTSYYLTNVCGNAYCSAVLFDASKAVVGNSVVANGTVVSGVLNVGSDTKYIRINIVIDGVDINAVMVNAGSTDLPYEPYFDGLRSAPTEAVESVGVNLTTAQAVYEGADRYAEMVVDGRNCIRFTSGKTIKNTPIQFEPNTQYTVSFYAKGENFNGATISNIGFTFFYEDGTSTEILVGVDGPWTLFTLTSAVGKTIKSIGLAVREYRAYVYLDTDTFMLNVGTTAQPYAPYTRNTLPIPEEVRNLDGYGWGINESVYNYIDWERKQFVKRVGCVDLGTLAWGYESAHARFYARVADCVSKSYVEDISICVIDFNTLVYRDGDRTNGYCVGDKAILVRDNAYTDAATFKASMSGVMLYYELAEPIITDISDLLPADNLIGVEGGGTVTMVNEYGYDVPNTVTFYEGKNEVVGADTFVGNLQGTAARAMADGEGKQLATREWVLEQLAALMSGGE